VIRSIRLVFPPLTNGIAAFFPLLLKSNCSPKHLKFLSPGVAYMSLPAGKAIHLVAFIHSLSSIRKLTDIFIIYMFIVYLC
jgi:hypothetical protein